MAKPLTGKVALVTGSSWGIGPATKILRWSVVLLLGLSGSVFAYQPDASFMKAQEKNKDKWAQEDQEIDKKLAALKTKFGKTPNIIYILADDVGWGELG